MIIEISFPKSELILLARRRSPTMTFFNNFLAVDFQCWMERKASLWWDKYLISCLFCAILASRNFDRLISIVRCTYACVWTDGKSSFLKIAHPVDFSFFCCRCHQQIDGRILALMTMQYLFPFYSWNNLKVLLRVCLP